MQPAWSTPGHVIAGRFQLIAPLGRGGMGTVWHAQHLTLHCPVAIKLIDPAIAALPDAVARFVREARSAAALRNPNVVQILDFGVDMGVPFIAMELLEGETLAQLIARERILTPPQTLHIVRQVARAIAKAHEAGVIHRDLKPENVFLTRHEEEFVVKVLDFGIAKVTGSVGEAEVDSSTRTGALVGSPAYMSPEQAWGKKDIDFRTDLYSLAIITFECLCGRVPFTSEALGELIIKICTYPLPVPSEIAPVPPAFDAWFARAAHREPGKRFQSAKDLSAALRQALSQAALPPDYDSSVDSAVLPPPPPVVPIGIEGLLPGRSPTVQASTISVAVPPPRHHTAGIAVTVFAGAAVAGLVAWAALSMRGPSSPAVEPSTSDPAATEASGIVGSPFPVPSATSAETAPAPPGATAEAATSASASASQPSTTPRAPPTSAHKRPVSKVLGL